VRGQELRTGVLYWIAIELKSLRSLRLSVSKRISKPVNAEAQRNAEGARSGRKIGEDEDGMGGVQEGIFCWIPRDCRSLRSPRLSVSKKILRTAKRRGAEHRRGCAVGEEDWNFVWNSYRMQISAIFAPLRFKKGIRTGKRRGAEERRGCAVGGRRLW
jgi:hypothetical protein